MRLSRVKRGLGKLKHDERVIDGFIEEMKTEIIGKEREEAIPAWVFRYGSAYVVITISEVQGRAVITFGSPIMEIPSERREELFQELLEKNARAGGAYFVIDPAVPDTILLQIARTTEDLDYDEFRNCLDTVGQIADLYDDQLKRKYLPRTG